MALAVAVVAVVLAQPGPAAAAGFLRIDVAPERPRAGEAAEVRVRTFVIVGGTNCIDDPKAQATPTVFYTGKESDSYVNLAAMQMEAVNADASLRLEIQLPRDETDPTLWRGQVVFPTAGRWALRMTYPYWQFAPVPDPCTGSSVEVTVLPARSECPAAAAANGWGGALRRVRCVLGIVNE